jgi:hypothetical protein
MSNTTQRRTIMRGSMKFGAVIWAMAAAMVIDLDTCGDHHWRDRGECGL